MGSLAKTGCEVRQMWNLPVFVPLGHPKPNNEVPLYFDLHKQLTGNVKLILDPFLKTGVDLVGEYLIFLLS